MPKKSVKKPISDEDCDDESYRKRRDRNNQAVKRSRYKSKQKTLETLERISKLKTENETLEDKVKTLTKELSFLKELFLAQAANNNSSLTDKELVKILSEESDEQASKS